MFIRGLVFIIFIVSQWTGIVGASEEGGGLQVEGAFTAVFQGTAGNSGAFGGDRGYATLQTDLVMGTSVWKTPNTQSSFLLNVAIQRGDGLTAGSTLVPLFTSPNGTASGTNNTVQGFVDPDAVNFKVARYQLVIFRGGLPRFRFSVGQLDLTEDFDDNDFAGDESFQFLAPIFNFNLGVDWGGQANFYGPGVVVSYMPDQFSSITFGYYQGRGRFEDVLSQPFLIGQGAIRLRFFGLPGDYRVYVWQRITPHALQSDLTQTRSRNTGVGFSINQKLSGAMGVWARFGAQDARVSQFDLSGSMGFEWVGPFITIRPYDVWGIGYGITSGGGQYKRRTGFNREEHYVETYYRFVITDAFHVSPDLQFINNPAGDPNVNSVWVFGSRITVLF